ncbi:cysteine desulfurase family protein [Pasteuria penetrans]|uniref:cysteine desulfurase family protein n=1 Tax=Pasteuria penetrans TaxID=86005 RepID=UPI000FA80B75|nr:cysteine desulfurase family protein [Pasteuria penetrans]
MNLEITTQGPGKKGPPFTNHPIYLDHAAGTSLAPGVLEAMLPYLTTTWGNPSSPHHFGRKMRNALEQARFSLAKAMGTQPEAVTFVSSGTEANHLALLSLATMAKQMERNHCIVSRAEHVSVLRLMEKLETQGLSVTRLSLSPRGEISLKVLEEALLPTTGFVSLHYVNNETGVLQPLREIANLLQKRDIGLHTDAVQAVGLVPIVASHYPNTIFTLAGHKIGGPAGTGALLLPPTLTASPQLLGGHQEQGKRAGTENTSGIVGLAHALQYAVTRRTVHRRHLIALRERFLALLREGGVSFQENGDPDLTLPHILNLSLANQSAPSFFIRLDLEGVSCSTGSACSAGAWKPSHVLTAMDLPAERISSALRFSFGPSTTLQEVSVAAQKVVRVYHSASP